MSSVSRMWHLSTGRKADLIIHFHKGPLD
jgi:hypothetical protein